LVIPNLCFLKQKMLSIKSKIKEESKVTANLLPCRIQHDGPITISPRYWAPETTSTFTADTANEESRPLDVKLNVHFRGRKLYGREGALPEGYSGKVIKVTKDVLQQEKPIDEEDERDEDEIVTFIAQQDASFDKFVIWRQEGEAMDSDDHYVKGINEWVSLAETVGCDETCI
jgi:ribonuclease H2 subunit C